MPRRLAPLFGAAAPLALAFLVFFGRGLDIIQSVELKTVDWRFRNFSEPGRHDPNIVLVAIDQASLDFFEKDTVYWPWPRSLYNALLGFCSAAHTKAVVFDMLFTNPSPYGASEDQEFGKGLKAAKAVAMAMEMGVSPAPLRSAAPAERFAAVVEGEPAEAAVGKASARVPVAEVGAGSSFLGDTAMAPDPDGVFRRVPLLSLMGGRYYPTMPAAVVMAVTGDNRVKATKNVLELGGIKIPLARGRMLVRFHGSALAPNLARGMKTYDAYPIGNLIQSWNAMENHQKPLLDPALFKGKIVFVSATAPGLLDNRPSPISPVFPGAEVIASAVDNILNRDFLTPASPPVALALILVAVFGAFAAARLLSGIQAVAAVVSISALAVVSAIIAFERGVWVDIAAPQLGLWLSFAGASAYGFAVEGKQKRFIQRAFSHYLSPEIVDEIVENPESLVLGGERREVTVYFSDIENFTTISESLTPERLTYLMNRYLGAMTETILEAGGTLDKYIGDAVMAFWGAPIPVADHALRACKAALLNQKKLAILRAELEREGFPPVRARIGLNSGPASIGNMGSALRFSYTAIGDHVNLASRLEGANKGYHTYLMISEFTKALAADAIETRELDFIKVKGKNVPIRVYELLGLKGEVAREVLDRVKTFESGLALYRSRKWDDAVATFKGIKDEVCEVYIERCRRLKDEPPPEDWDGSFALTEK